MTYSDLNYEVRGPENGPPILLLHGWGSSIQSMRPLAEALSDDYRTYALDMPGHGRSPAPPEAWGVPEHAELLHEFIEDEVGEPTTVIGHSNGGRIALFMASTPNYSDVIRRLILISPSGVEPTRGWGYTLRSGMATILKTPVQILPAPLRDPAMDWLRHSLVWRMLGSSDYNTLSGVMRETFVKTVNYHLDGALEHIDVPTLVFWGTEDEAISRRQIQTIENAVDDCGMVELEGAGHYGHIDQFASVLSGTRHFLENS